MSGAPPIGSHPAAHHHRNDGGFVHTLVVHDSPDQLAEAVAAFVEEGVALGEPVLANVDAEEFDVIRSRLGAAAAAATSWSDTTSWMAHPARRLAAIEDLAAAQSRPGGRRLRFVGRCAWPASSSPAAAEWERFDCALNVALAPFPVTMVCAYDASVLDEALVERARRSHPLVGARPFETNPRYDDPESWLLAERHELVVPAGAALLRPVRTPAAGRAFLRAALAGTATTAPDGGRALPGAGLSTRQLAELEVVATELVTNALRAGARSVELACWSSEAGVAVQVSDEGPGLGDPLAGYRRPPRGASGGRGLWIARQLTDALEIDSSPAGTAVRAFVVPAARQTRPPARGRS